MNALAISSSLNSVQHFRIWTQHPGEKKRAWVSFALALVLHAALLAAGGIAWIHSAEYGVEMADNGVELHLVAALPSETVQGIKAETQPVAETKDTEMKMTAPPAVKGQEKPAQAKAAPAAKKSEHQGDGSSAEPGIHKTTLHTAGGGTTDEKPGYLKNPAPPYPRDAIENSQEGLVMLWAKIDRRGNVTDLSVLQSSGVRSLDESALKTVKKWKFKPAKTGMLTVESQTLIPVRFRLEDAKKR